MGTQIVTRRSRRNRKPATFLYIGIDQLDVRPLWTVSRILQRVGIDGNGFVVAQVAVATSLLPKVATFVTSMLSACTSEGSVWSDTIRMTADDQECWPLAGAVVLALLVIIVLKANDMVPEGTITVASHAILVMLAAIIIYKAIAILRGARQAINRPVNVAQLASPADDDPQQGHDPSLAPLLGRRSHET